MPGSTSETITLGGSGGTEKVLVKINGGEPYSSEYYLREATQDYRLKVTHSGAGVRDRHYVELKNTVFATTGATPTEEIIRTASVVILGKPSDASATITDLVEGLAFFLNATNIPKLLAWQS